MAEETSTHSLEQAFEDILETDLEGCTLHVCLASIGAEDNAPRFERIQLEEDEELAKEFEGIVEGVLKRYKREKDAGSLRLCDYEEGAAVSDSHEVECVDLSDRNFIGEQISGLESLSDLGLFRADHAFVDGLKFYVIVLQRADGTTINFFRSYRPSKEVTRSTGFAAFFSATGSSTRCASPPSCSIATSTALPRDVTCSCCRGTIFRASSASLKPSSKKAVILSTKSELGYLSKTSTNSLRLA